jgi:hypothetical protein
MRIKVSGAPPRYRICPDCGDAHDTHDWPDNHARPEERLARPSYIADDQPFIKNMVDGKMYDSKSRMRETYKPGGNKDGERYIELGNEEPIHFKRPEVPDLKPYVERAASKLGIPV